MRHSLRRFQQKQVLTTCDYPLKVGVSGGSKPTSKYGFTGDVKVYTPTSSWTTLSPSPPHRLHSHLLMDYTFTLTSSQATLPPPHGLHFHLLTNYTPTSQATLPPPHRLYSHLLTGYTPTSSHAGYTPTSSQATLPPPRTICSPLRLVSATTYLKPIPNGPPV